MGCAGPPCPCCPGPRPTPAERWRGGCRQAWSGGHPCAGDRELVAISRALRRCAEGAERRRSAGTGFSGRAPRPQPPPPPPAPRTVPAAWSSRWGGQCPPRDGAAGRGPQAGSRPSVQSFRPWRLGPMRWQNAPAPGEGEGEGANAAERERERARETALLRHSAGLPRGAYWQPGSWRARRSDRLPAHNEPPSASRAALRLYRAQTCRRSRQYSRTHLHASYSSLLPSPLAYRRCRGQLRCLSAWYHGSWYPGNAASQPRIIITGALRLLASRLLATSRFLATPHRGWPGCSRVTDGGGS